MNKLTNEEFLAWVKKHDWLKINEAATPKGRLDTYMTPAGKIVLPQYNLQGELENFAKPIPMMPQPMRMPGQGFDLRGGPHLP